MQQNEFPKLIMTAGTPRSGSNATVFSFDGHPEVLVWPFDFSYFPFFQEISGDEKKISIQRLNQVFLQESMKSFENINNDERLNTKIDFSIFEQHLLDKTDKEVSALEYLTIIFEAFKQVHRQYSNKSIKYYMMNLTSARGLDWYNEEIFQTCFVIFNFRKMEESYSSIREKYFSLNNYDLKTFFSVRGKKTSIYWMEHFRRVSDYAQQRITNSNFLIVPLVELQNKPEDTLKKLCKSFEIEPHENLNKLTRLGIHFGGNANEKVLNKGTISTKPSKVRVPLCQFEKKMFDSFGLFNFIDKHERVPIKFSKYDMLKSAFISAFFELPNDCIWYNKSGNSLLFSVIGKTTIFLNLCAIYFIMKNKQLTLFVIKKYNKHVEAMTFWN